MAVAQVPVVVPVKVVEPVSVAEVPVARKWELKQFCWHSVYFLVSAGVPVPWGQAATQRLVSLAWLSLGQGTL